MPKKSLSIFTSDFFEQKQIDPVGGEKYWSDHRLWWAVLERAIVDASRLDHPNGRKRNDAKRAARWLLTNQRDFRTVCHLASVDPDKFRERTSKWLNKRFSAELLRSVDASRV
jgi:hypothetical protein